MGEGGVLISNKNYFCDIFFFFFESAKRKVGQEEDHKVKGRYVLLRLRKGFATDRKMGARRWASHRPALPGRHAGL